MLKLAATLATLCCLPSLARAWGGEGHQVVALIAEARLTPAAQAGIHTLLGADVDISDAEIASWADQIRRERRNTGPWHYVDIPLDAAGYDPKRDGNDGQNVIDAIDREVAILGDRRKSIDARAEALKFIVHFVGDLEQPLHCAERDGDKGGNACLVWMPEARGKASNLHAVWDGAMLRTYIGTSKIADYADTLNAAIKDTAAAAWASGSTASWANESHAVAIASVYRGVPSGEATHLTQGYVDRARPVVEKQLERGGVRLAKILNASFTDSPMLPASSTTRPATRSSATG